MMEYIDPYLLKEADFLLLCEGGKPGGWKQLDIAHRLLDKSWLAFKVPGGIFAVEKIGSRLYVRALAISGFGWSMRGFRNSMDRLAADLSCDTVETTTFTPRLTEAMLRIRGRVESWNMVWQVEGGARPLSKGEDNGQ